MRKNGNTWSITETIQSPNSEDNWNFGIHIRTYGNELLIGSDPSFVSHNGTVAVFDIGINNHVLKYEIESSLSSGGFGKKFDVQNDFLAVIQDYVYPDQGSYYKYIHIYNKAANWKLVNVTQLEVPYIFSTGNVGITDDQVFWALYGNPNLYGVYILNKNNNNPDFFDLQGIPTDFSDGIDDVDDADNDPMNEIETWSTLAGIPSDLQDGDDVDDADNNASNELQTISKSGSTVTLSNGGGNFTDEVNDADADSNNEKITSINLSGEILTIDEPANSQTVDLATIATQWEDDGADIYISNKVGIGIADPQEELDMSGTFQVTKNSSSGNPHINLVETGADFIRFYMENNTGNRAVIAANPKTDTQESIINFFLDGAGDVMTIKGNELVGINDITPLHTMEVNAANTTDDPLIIRTGGTEHLEILENGHILIGNNVNDEASKLIKVANGAYLSTGGSWTNASSRSLKQNFQSVDAQDILLKLAALNILRWNYKSDSTATHLGPIAEEFYKSFNLGGNDKSISTVDASGVALVAIQALYQESEKMKKENQELKKEIETMKNQLQEFMQRVAVTEAEMKH